MTTTSQSSRVCRQSCAQRSVNKGLQSTSERGTEYGRARWHCPSLLLKRGRLGGRWEILGREGDFTEQSSVQGELHIAIQDLDEDEDEDEDYPF